MQASRLWLHTLFGGQILLKYDVTHRFRLKCANTEELNVCGSHHLHRGPQEAGRVIPRGSRGHCLDEGNLHNPTKALLVQPAVYFLFMS
jgi:hypothetical protein